MKLIRFHGHLKDLYPEGIRVEAGSAVEAIGALQNYPGFREEDGVIHQVILPDFQSRDALYDLTDREIIEVHPMMQGAGGKWGAYIQIIVGIILIATGWGAGAGQGVLGSGISAMTLSGALMVLGGVTALLMPTPKLDTANKEENRSNYLNATKNTVKIGTRIPLIFGVRKWYGHYLSFNVSATDKGAPKPVVDPTFGKLLYLATVDQYSIYEAGDI